MIFVHLLIGIILGSLYGNYLFFILGSIFPDIDHLYILVKHRLFSVRKIIDSIKFEKKYDIRYKTPLFHSLLGLILSSSVIFLFNRNGALYFAIAYLLHLLIDWLDIDEKYYLYPLKIKFKGFLPIWSTTEKIITIILIIFTIKLMI
jgi:hypothetical protein